ncbi:MAG: zinc ribbon domain-containing protein [Anaerovoracaceae bacterium]
MALIECKYCGQKISDKAEQCPHCGEKVEAAVITEASVCEECGAELEEGAAVCPVCGCPVRGEGQVNQGEKASQPEKPAEKKNGKAKYIIIGVIALVLIFAGIAIFGGGEDKPDPNGDSGTAQVSEDAEAEGNDAENAGAQEEDTQLTAAELYQLIGENATDPFTISETAAAFIDAHPDFFPGNAKNQGAISDFMDVELDYQHVAKAPSKYQDTLMWISGDVIDIEEAEIEGNTITAFHVYDYDGKSYMVYHLGELENVFEDSWVWAYVLPFGMTSFENLSGGYTEAIICASCYVGGDAEVIE